MTIATGSEGEVPFVRGMERAVDEDEAEKIVSKFRLDGWITERIRGIWASMHQDRGPPDYATESEFERGMRAGRRTSYVNGDAPREPNGEKRLLQWILGVLSALVVLATAGGVTLYGKFTALEATVTTGMSAHEQRLNRVEQRLDRIGTAPVSP